MFDYSKLIGRIIEKFGTRGAFAAAVGVSENTMSQKLNGKMKITVDDIIAWIEPEYLDIPVADIPAYFFTKKVQAS